jgi:hypothetical protein
MAKPKPSRVAAALQYLQQMRDRAADFGGGVVDTLGERAQDVGGLAYEALTSDPNIGRMTTAEFSQAAAARPSTPRLDATAQGIGAMGKALVTQPVQTAKAVVVDPVVEAFESPRAMGQFAGEFVNPLRKAAALRKTAPIAELDVYHGTPHRFPGTEENPLGEFDASKINTGEGAQAYGRGIYFAESPDVAKGYRDKLNDPIINRVKADLYEIADAPQWSIKAFDDTGKVIPKVSGYLTPDEIAKHYGDEVAELVLGSKYGGDFKNLAIQEGSLYKADLPDDMIDRMLDWDKPLSEQPAGVRKLFPSLDEATAIDAEMTRLSESALTAGDINSPAQAAWDAMYKSPRYKLAKVVVDEANPKLKGKFANGEEVYKAIGGGKDKVASETLRSLGIPGIRYLDAGSRGKDGTGTRNFVVFPGEEKKVKILKRD